MIDLYSKENCPACVQVKNWLRDEYIDYEEFVLYKDVTVEEVRAKYPLASTVPFFIIDGVFIGGFNEFREYQTRTCNEIKTS